MLARNTCYITYCTRWRQNFSENFVERMERYGTGTFMEVQGKFSKFYGMTERNENSHGLLRNLVINYLAATLFNIALSL